MTSGGARKGAGRKPTGRNIKPAIQVRLTLEQKRWLTTRADTNGESVSKHVYRLLVEKGMPNE